MSLYSIIIVPVLFGLIGFVEPCSLGINSIFLNHIQKFDKMKRVRETLIFALLRGVVLALVGITAAFIGREFITIQGSLFTILGVIYFALGLFIIVKKYLPVFNFKIDFSNYFKDKHTVSLGIVFGFVIPACSIPFIIALISQAVLLQSLFEGFVTGKPMSTMSSTLRNLIPSIWAFQNHLAAV